MDRTQPDLLRKPARLLQWAAVVVALFALLSAWLAWTRYQTSVASITDDAHLRARGAAADVDRYIQSRWWTLEAIAQMPVVQSGDLAGMRQYFNDLDSRAMGFDAGISFIDAQGWMQVRNGEYAGPPLDFSARDHIRQALATGQPTVSSAFIGTVNEAPIIAFAVPVFDDGHVIRGFVAAGLRLNELSIGADHLRYAGGTDVVILDPKGQIVTGKHASNGLATVDPAFPLDEIRAAGEGARASVTGPAGGADQVLGFATAPNAGWTVLVETPAAEAFADVRLGLFVQLLAILAGTALALVVLGWAGRRLQGAVLAERRTLAQLETAVSALEQRQQLSDAFVGVMSHELRTPVTTIYGAAKVLARSPTPDHIAALLPDIEEEADRLQRITEDLLVLSRAEHGLVRVTPEPVLVQRLVPTIVGDVRRRVPTAEIRVRLPSELPAIFGETGAFRQALTNLLSNAAKYGGSSPIEVFARREGDEVVVDVLDRGPGLSPEEYERIFELFYRSDQNSRQASGTGIGLFVVRELATAMAGSVDAAPRPGGGSRFSLRLRRFALRDLEATETPGPPAGAVPSGSGGAGSGGRIYAPTL